MQVRGLLVAVVLLGLLAGGVYWSDRKQAADESKQAEDGGGAKLTRVSADDILRLEIQRKDAPSALVLERDQSTKEWQMRAPETWRADQAAVAEVAGSYAGLGYDRVLDEKPTDLGAYGLNTPAVTLTVTAKGGKTSRVLLGEESPTGTGVYLKLDNDPRVFLVSTAVRQTIDKTPKDLRDKRLLVFDSSKLTRVELGTRAGLIEFSRAAVEKDWQITKPRPQRADHGKVEDLVQKLVDARMDVSGTDEELAKTASNFAFGSRVATASVVEGSNGTPQTLEVRKKGDEYFARSSAVGGAVFKVANDTGEALNKTLAEFQNKKLFDFAFNEPSTLTVRDNDKSYAFRKSGDKWVNPAGKQVDAVGVQSAIDKLRDLSATGFVESAFAAPPVIEAALSWDGGKRSEKVLIVKQGAGYIARRENEPGTTYVLDPKAVEEIQRSVADVKEAPPPSAPANAPAAKK